MDNGEPKESYQELFDRVVKPIVPLNEFLYEGTRNYYDSTTQRAEILAEENKIQSDMIRDLKERVEDLTRIVNVLAQRPEMIDRRKLNMQQS